MPAEPVAINKPLVGIIAGICLITGIVMYIRVGGDAMSQSATGAFIRVGLVMLAFWYALPPKGQEAPWAHVSPWTLVGIIGGIFFTVTRPRVAIPLLLILAVTGFFLRPRKPKRPNRNF